MIEERLERQAAVDRAFASGSVRSATDHELDEYLRTLCTGYVDNERVRHRELLRGLTIHHIQTSRLIRLLDHQNQRVTTWFMILAIIGTATGLVQIWFAIQERTPTMSWIHSHLLPVSIAGLGLQILGTLLLSLFSFRGVVIVSAEHVRVGSNPITHVSISHGWLVAGRIGLVMLLVGMIASGLASLSSAA